MFFRINPDHHVNLLLFNSSSQAVKDQTQSATILILEHACCISSAFLDWELIGADPTSILSSTVIITGLSLSA
jgi:hypothetical protein